MGRRPPAATIFELRDRGEKVHIWGVDVTNHCNAACWYCPHPDHERARGFISRETFAAVLDCMANDRVNLHFFSEPLVHRDLEGLVAMATERGIATGFSTNGKLLTQARLDRLAAAGLRWLRLHTNAHGSDRVPYGRRVDEFVCPDGLVFTEHRVGDSGDGQLDEQVWDKGMTSQGGHLQLDTGGQREPRCSYLGTAAGPTWEVVMWDGRFAMCCVDIEGSFDTTMCSSCDGVVVRSPEVLGDLDGTGSAPAEQMTLEDTRG